MKDKSPSLIRRAFIFHISVQHIHVQKCSNFVSAGLVPEGTICIYLYCIFIIL